MIIGSKPSETAFSLRVIARLLSYPDAEMRSHLPEMRDALHAERGLEEEREHQPATASVISLAGPNIHESF